MLAGGAILRSIWMGQVQSGQTAFSVQVHASLVAAAFVFGFIGHAFIQYYLNVECEEPCKTIPCMESTFKEERVRDVDDFGIVRYELVNVTCYGPFECGSLARAPKACKTWVGWIVVMGIQAFADFFFRAYVVYTVWPMAKRVEEWWAVKEAVEDHASGKLQAAYRGNRARDRVREEHGVVTTALAGLAFQTKLYRPATPIERKVQIIMKDMAVEVKGNLRKLQSFHFIKAQGSATHKVFLEINKLFHQFDMDNSGALEFGEASACMRDLGAHLPVEEMEFLFVEAFGKAHEPDKAFKISQADARKLRKAGRDLDDVSDLSGLDANGLDDSMRPTVGEHVMLSHQAITKNVNDVLQKGPLTPSDIGIVTRADVESKRFTVRAP